MALWALEQKGGALDWKRLEWVKPWRLSIVYKLKTAITSIETAALKMIFCFCTYFWERISSGWKKWNFLILTTCCETDQPPALSPKMVTSIDNTCNHPSFPTSIDKTCISIIMTVHHPLCVQGILKNVTFWTACLTGQLPAKNDYLFNFHACLLHTWYLSFFLHEQNFWRIKFTPKNANFSR